MYRLMRGSKINLEPRIMAINMKAEVKLKQPDPNVINNHIVILSTMKENNPSPCINTEFDNGDSKSTTSRMRKQLSRLTQPQQKLIIETFKLIDSDPVKTGLRILLKLFSEHPQHKQIWPQFRQIPDSSLMSAVQLRRHASVYMGGFRNIIQSMSDEDELILQMNRIAKAHKKWNIHRRHVMDMLQPLLETLKECNNGQMDEDLKTAWTTFFDVIADFIEIYRD